MFAWSFGCTGLYSPFLPPRISFARLERTSFTFMLNAVPAPIWKTSTGNWSRSLPPRISSQALTMASAEAGGSSPALWLASAAAFFT
jgi:hypothetical protein